MNARLLLSALVLTVVPGLAMAMCAGERHDQVTMSCPEGQSYDADSATCQPTPTG